jgi:Fe-S cluster assembly iron-binding protein IscA
LRITSTSDGTETFSVSRADSPLEGDQVIGEEGALVFVDPGAAMILDDMVLDAQVEGEGVVRFELQPQ